MSFPAPDPIGRLSEQPLDWRFKAAPVAAQGLTVREFLATGPRLADLQTPLLSLDGQALTANLERMAQWCQSQGVSLAPHGKTTMAPQLWQRQLERGAWGITLANLAQMRVASEFGMPTIMLANALVDREAIRWTAAAVAAGTRIVSWVDDLQTVQRIDAVLAELPVEMVPSELEVLVELGGAGGRTGARGIQAALEVAAAVADSPRLRLAGVAGYEGSLAHDASVAGLAAVRDYLSEFAGLHEALLAQGCYAPGRRVILSAGGSAYFDLVLEAWGQYRAEGVEILLRSGAYLVHDDGFYRGVSPFSRADQGQPFAAGMHAWARVVSQPEPGLAILDAGKRDLPFDEGLPEPQGIAVELGAGLAPLPGATITAVNDQHCYLAFDPASTEVRIGQVVRLGLSHPCTAFDKWTLIPVLDGDRVVDLVRTFF